MVAPPPTTPTTTSSTNVIVPSIAAPAPSRSPYLEWDGVVFLVGGVFAAMMIFSKVLEFVKGIYEFTERKKKKDKEQDAPLEARLKSLEEAHKTFRSKDDLEREFQELNRKVDHEKDNRRMIQDNFNTRLQNTEQRQTDIQIEVTKLSAKVDTVADNAARVEEAVEALRERVDERFDRLHEVLLSRITPN